jgi:hypothetical protein
MAEQHAALWQRAQLCYGYVENRHKSTFGLKSRKDHPLAENGNSVLLKLLRLRTAWNRLLKHVILVNLLAEVLSDFYCNHIHF